MRWLFLLLFLLGCGTRYEKNDLQLLTAYRAKEMCSCVFVMGRDETFCENWTAASPNVATVSVDLEKKTVRTEALMLWGAEARFVSERFGCVLE